MSGAYLARFVGQLLSLQTFVWHSYNWTAEGKNILYCVPGQNGPIQRALVHAAGSALQLQKKKGIPRKTDIKSHGISCQKNNSCKVRSLDVSLKTLLKSCNGRSKTPLLHL